MWIPNPALQQNRLPLIIPQPDDIWMVEQKHGRDTKWGSVKTRLSPFSAHTAGPERGARGLAPAWVTPSNASQARRIPTQEAFLAKFFKNERAARATLGLEEATVMRRISCVCGALLEVIYMQVKQISPTLFQENAEFHTDLHAFQSHWLQRDCLQ